MICVRGGINMSKFMIASEENQFALAHYGIKGMKWGKKTAPIDKTDGGYSRALSRGRIYGTDPLAREYVRSDGKKYRNLYDTDYKKAKDRADTIRDKRNNNAYNNGSEAGKRAGDYAADRKIRIDAENRMKEARRKEKEAKEKAAEGSKDKRESVVINGKTYKVDGESYITKDNFGNTIRANSQAELDAINEKKRKDKKDRIKNNIKNLGQRIKNTAKGLKK